MYYKQRPEEYPTSDCVALVIASDTQEAVRRTSLVQVIRGQIGKYSQRLTLSSWEEKSYDLTLHSL